MERRQSEIKTEREKRHKSNRRCGEGRFRDEREAKEKKRTQSTHKRNKTKKLKNIATMSPG